MTKAERGASICIIPHLTKGKEKTKTWNGINNTTRTRKYVSFPITYEFIDVSLLRLIYIQAHFIETSSKNHSKTYSFFFLVLFRFGCVCFLLSQWEILITTTDNFVNWYNFPFRWYDIQIARTLPWVYFYCKCTRISLFLSLTETRTLIRSLARSLLLTHLQTKWNLTSIFFLYPYFSQQDLDCNRQQLLCFSWRILCIHKCVVAAG